MRRLFNDPNATWEARDRHDHGRDRHPEDDGQLIKAREHLNHNTKKGNGHNNENANGALGDVTVVAKGVGDHGVKTRNEQNKDVVLEFFKILSNGGHDGYPFNSFGLMGSFLGLTLVARHKFIDLDRDWERNKERKVNTQDRRH